MSRAQLTAQEEQEKVYKQVEKRNIAEKLPKVCKPKGKGKVTIVVKAKPMDGMMPGMVG
jgi:hypothetical protein